MLTLLAEYAQLLDTKTGITATPVRPREVLAAVGADLEGVVGGQRPIRVQIDETCPDVVSLDTSLAYTALKFAILNALSCSEQGPVEISARGEMARWIIAIRDQCDLIPEGPEGILASGQMQRLVSNRRERRGLDLAIAIEITELFGGSIRLQRLPSGGHEIQLDWPTRLPEP